MGHGKRQWQDLSPRQRTAIVVIGTAQLALHGYACVDLIRRPADQINGPKLPWGVSLLVNWIGPIAYLARGRKES